MATPPEHTLPAITLQAALRQAVEHHRAGRLSQAEQLYRAILQQQPKQPDANHNLGLIAVQVGRHDVALPHFQAALAALPTHEQYLLSCAGSLLACGRAADAQALLELALHQGVRSDALQAMLDKTRNGSTTSATSRASDAAAVPQQDLQNLIALFNAGRHAEVETLAQQHLQGFPESGFLWKILGASLQIQGKDALPALRRAVALLPGEADAHNNLGVALQRAGRHEEAAACSRRALDINPEFVEAHRNLGNALFELKEYEPAAASFRHALQLRPDAETQVNLGIALRDLGQREQALACFKEAEQRRPDSAIVQHHLACALLGLGQADAAIAAYRRAIALDPHLVVALISLGNLLQRQGHSEEAAALYGQAVAARPDHAEAHNNLGVALRDLGRHADALTAFERAIACKADFAAAYSNRGSALLDLGRLDEAIASCRRAVEIDADFAEAQSNLGHALHIARRYDEALAAFQRALAINPDFADAHSNLGALQRDRGELEAAVQSCRRALALKPDFADAHSNLLFSSNYLSLQEPAALLADARRFGAMAASRAEAYTTWPNRPDAKRSLRIGLVSGDLCRHPVGFFLDRSIAALAARSAGRLELVAYATRADSDALTERLKASCAAWHNVAGLSDRQLAGLIRSDGIDILLDLSGHTTNNRLTAFAWKAAPIQATWLGYFATTGVAAIDYLIADPWTLPPKEEANFTEKIWRLPETRLCFSPPDIDVDVAPLPALENGRITFGCFNNLSKLNEGVIVLWADILRAVPESRLFLKNKQFGEAGAREGVSERFAAHGINAARLTLEGPSSRADYLRSYNRIDIALDPFPYTGGTTTAEALWMGVPVLTLAGERFLARQGVGLLKNAGLPEWIARDRADYLARAVMHAANSAQLARLRSNLRAQVLASPIFDAARFARHFEAMLREMWTLWCKKTLKPAQKAARATPPTQKQTDQLVALFHAGRYAEVEQFAQTLLAQHPDSGFTWKVLGAALQLQGKDALPALRKAVELTPQDAHAHNNLGLALMERRQLDEGIACYRRALQILPDLAEAHSNLGNALQAKGDAQQAVASCRSALQLKPDFADALCNLGNALRDLGQLDEAVASCRRALAINPNLAPAWSNLGNALRDQRKVAEAIDCYQRALQLDARLADAHHNLGVAYYGEGRFVAALACHENVLRTAPDYPDVYRDLAHVYRELGRCDDAITSYRKALERRPDSLEMRSDMLFMLNYQAQVTAKTMVAEATRYGALAERRAHPYAAWGNLGRIGTDSERRLRIGFVSGDLHSHPVGYFVEGVLAALAADARDRLELFAYPTHRANDAMSQRIQACCNAWRPARDLDDEELAAQIHNDGIDILIDLSGHTMNNRLPMFAWRPAPVQVSWLGYVATTGLSAMDYYIADSYAVPESSDDREPESEFVEKVWRMPESMICFTPSEFDLAVSAPPSAANGYITFGSFNNLTKVNDEVIKRWSQILLGVPGSRILLNTKQLNDAAISETIWGRFAAHGIGRERVMLEFVTPRAGSIAAYSRVDIALDPFPYNGGTTTAEALWMGVPVLTLAGNRLAGRMGVSQLANVGLHDWIAQDQGEYLAKAKTFADVSQLASLRAGMRARVLASPLFDAPRFAGHFEAALRGMWRKWCSAQ
jgi:predicted O-linked N-acetylglucosamine transferase (SPINDLY family)